MRRSVVTTMARIVSVLCVLCVRLFGVYSCLATGLDLTDQQVSKHVTCYQRWFDVREIDSDLLLEVGLWRNLLDFLAHNTEMRGCDEVIVGLIGGERAKWIL